MKHKKARYIGMAQTLTVSAVLLFGNPSFAETRTFRVAFMWVPGTEQIEAGNLRAGIKELEDQLAQIELESSGDILTTLCAAYIVNRSLDKAERVCDKAVEINPTESAYNNRGVFRAYTGDLSGAREDFERIRPRQLEVYLENLWVRDVPLIATGNFDVVDKLLSKRALAEVDSTVASSAARIENVIE